MKICTTDKDTNCKKRPEKLKQVIISALVWLIIWELLALAVDNVLLLPSPQQTVKALALLAVSGRFYLNILWTVARCGISMILSFTIGVLMAALAYKAALIKRLLALPVGFFKAVPVMAIIIYVILLAKSDWVAVIVCFLMCFPVVYTNITEGLEAMSSQLLEVVNLYGFSLKERVSLFYAPGLLPHIKASVSLIAGLSWKAVVAAEVLSIPKFSLGYEMINAKYYLETDKLFAYIFVIVILSLSFEKLIKETMSGLEYKPYKYSKVERYRSNPKVQPEIQCAPEIKFSCVDKSFEGKKILDNYNGFFSKGKVTAIMGPSGEGKTTLGRLAGGISLPDDGFVLIDGAFKLAYLFQEDRLFPWLNVYDNMVLGMAKCSFEQVKKMAEDLEIADSLWELPSQLSGGMKHRVALGRTFLPESNFIILDEPFRGLDGELKERIIQRVWSKFTEQKTVILITHNRQDAQTLADIIIEL